MNDYKQFDLVWVKFPFSDKPEKSKKRPAIIVSNEKCNQLDNDVLLCPITSIIRSDEFSFFLNDDMLSQALDHISEIRCNKVTTVRNSFIISKIADLLPEYQDEVLVKINDAFEIDGIQKFSNPS